MQLKIDALKEAAAWPGADQRTTVVLASQLMAAELYQEGFEYFAALLGTANPPTRSRWRSLERSNPVSMAGPGRRSPELDAATGLDLGLPHYFRGTSLARLPGCAGRPETVAADLEFRAAVKEPFPPGLLRAAYEGLSHAMKASAGRRRREVARSRSGRLITDYWVTPGDGFGFTPQQFAGLAPDVHVAQGYYFSDFAFVVTADGIVAIDAASTPEHAASALRDLREITELPITHVILTHAHFDHVGGLDALTADGATLIAQANFPDELQRQNSGPVLFRYFLPARPEPSCPSRTGPSRERAREADRRRSRVRAHPDRRGRDPRRPDHPPPDREVVFTGDMSMPYLGAPFFAEGSAEGLFEAMETVMALHPRLLIHGHAGLTAAYTIEAFPGLLAAFRNLHERRYGHGITGGLTLVEILRLNHLPKVLRITPRRSSPIWSPGTTSSSASTVSGPGTGIPAGEGLEHFHRSRAAAAADLLGGGTAAAFRMRAPSSPAAASTRSRCGSSTWGCSATPARPSSSTSGSGVLQRLVERHQRSTRSSSSTTRTSPISSWRLPADLRVPCAPAPGSTSTSPGPGTPRNPAAPARSAPTARLSPPPGHRTTMNGPRPTWPGYVSIPGSRRKPGAGVRRAHRGGPARRKRGADPVGGARRSGRKRDWMLRDRRGGAGHRRASAPIGL